MSSPARSTGFDPTPAASSLAVLLVASQDDTRALYAKYLTLEGCDVEEAEDGPQGLAKALARRYHVIVVDARLPGFDGYQLCRLLRGDFATATTPTAVVIGEAFAAAAERARAAGASAVLVKPCLPHVLLSEVRRLALGDAAADAPLERGVAAAHAGDGSHRPLSHSYVRGDTTSPPKTPPVLMCPSCDTPLTYTHSHVGGVSIRHPEQWDYYECPAHCGVFVYRQRTRKMRKVDDAVAALASGSMAPASGRAPTA